MTGPKIIQTAPTEDEQVKLDLTAHHATGIRRTNTGGWAAVKNGRLIDTFSGLGCKVAAIRAAGTNTVIG